MRAFSSAPVSPGNSPVLKISRALNIMLFSSSRVGSRDGFRSLLVGVSCFTHVGFTRSNAYYPKRMGTRLMSCTLALKIIMLSRVCSRVTLNRRPYLAWPCNRCLQTAASQQAYLEPLGSHPGISCLSLNRPQSKNAISTTLLQVNLHASVISYVD